MVGLAGGGDGDWTSQAARALARSLLEARTVSAQAPARTRQARKSVHLISAVAPNDAKLNDILDEAAAALKAATRADPVRPRKASARCA